MKLFKHCVCFVAMSAVLLSVFACSAESKLNETEKKIYGVLTQKLSDFYDPGSVNIAEISNTYAQYSQIFYKAGTLHVNNSGECFFVNLSMKVKSGEYGQKIYWLFTEAYSVIYESEYGTSYKIDIPKNTMIKYEDIGKELTEYSDRDCSYLSKETCLSILPKMSESEYGKDFDILKIRKAFLDYKKKYYI